ncbi:hypothetical protein INT48_006351 [Thamnidium elegans]|uniref:Uncharacterized protein n=1 Tax=Thamnidium elegans TaxID=101142 RepID=A0A8H7VS35_9FUNG|nr:hypothetical protein INT48_006351 [Thamnidium elegans]
MVEWISLRMDPYKLDELTSYSAYIARDKFMMENKRVSNEIKAHAVHLVDVHPKISARAVALDLGLEPRRADGDLAVTTKNAITEFYYKQPTATAEQLLDQLTSTFEEDTTRAFRAKQYREDSSEKEMDGGDKEHRRRLYEQLRLHRWSKSENNSGMGSEGRVNYC